MSTAPPIPSAPHTGDVCNWCGRLLTVTDAASSSPGLCAECRMEADRAEAALFFCHATPTSGHAKTLTKSGNS
jgi:hypothetical protein